MNLPALHQRAWIVLPHVSDARFAVKVEDVEAPYVQVQAPLDRDARLALEPGRLVRLQYFDTDGHVMLETHVAGSAGGDSVRLQVLDSARNQRRQYLRWEVDLPVRLRYGDDEAAGEAGFFRGRMIDLGGGGLAVRVGRELEQNRPLVVQMRLPTGPVQAEAEVVTQRADGASYRVGMRFCRIAEAARSRIVRFVFQEEVRWRKALNDGP